MSFNLKNHIIGKTYEYSQENMHQMLVTIDDQAAEIALLREALEGMVGHNLPTCYDGEYDDCGSCPYCGNLSYKDHDETCAVIIAEQALATPQEVSK